MRQKGKIVPSSLHEWLGYGSEDQVSKTLATFLCSKNPEVESFLHTSAIEYEIDSSARTYLCVDTETYTIAGYFTVSIGFADIQRSEELTDNERTRLKMYKCPDHRIPCYLIGQLGRDDRYAHDSLSGRDILEMAMFVLSDTKKRIGGKFVIVECEDCLVKLYESEEFGFKLFNRPSKKNRYNQLYRML